MTGTGTIAKDNPFRFSTKRTDDTTDLVLYEYRAYSPSLGRWPSRDPLGEQGGINLCAFLRNSPINDIDLFGTLSSAECKQLFESILSRGGQLITKMDKYNPIEDGKGGHPYFGGTQFTKPGEHYVQIRSRQNRLVKDIQRYLKECLKCDDCGPWGGFPEVVVEAVTKSVSKPIFPEGSSWPLLIPGSPSDLEFAGDVAEGVGFAAGVGTGVGVVAQGGKTLCKAALAAFLAERLATP